MLCHYCHPHFNVHTQLHEKLLVINNSNFKHVERCHMFSGLHTRKEYRTDHVWMSICLILRTSGEILMISKIHITPLKDSPNVCYLISSKRYNMAKT